MKICHERFVLTAVGAILSLSTLLAAKEASAFALTLDRRTDGTVTPLLWSDQFLRRNPDGTLFRDQNDLLVLDLRVAGVNLLDGEPGALGRAVDTWNNLAPPQTPAGDPGANLEQMQAGDVSRIIGGDRFDLESILLHELGHALALTHPNLADRTQNRGDDRRFTASLRGQVPFDPAPVYHLDSGFDGVPGTADDARDGDRTNDVQGGDRSLNFVAAGNDPFVNSNGPYLLDGPYNAPMQGYSQAPTREVAAALGYQNLEAVMVQGIEADERQRALAWDDVLGVQYLERGADQVAGTNDDFLINLILLGPNDPGFATAPIQVRNVGSDDIGVTTVRFPRGGVIENAVTEFERTTAGTPVSWTDTWMDTSPTSASARITGVNIFVVRSVPEPGTLALIAGAAAAALWGGRRRQPGTGGRFIETGAPELHVRGFDRCA